AMGLTTVDHRADIYSLGCTLYYLLMGRPPYQGPTMMAILLKHKDAPIPSISADRGEVPASLDQVFRRMVAKKPEERFASLAEVLHALEAPAIVPDLQPRQFSGPAARQSETPTPTLDVTRVAPDTADAANQTVDLRPASKPDAGGMTVLLVEPSRSQAV